MKRYQAQVSLKFHYGFDALTEDQAKGFVVRIEQNIKDEFKKVYDSEVKIRTKISSLPF